MELQNFEIEVLERFSYSQLSLTKTKLEELLVINRELKDSYITVRDTPNAIEQEKLILTVCDNLDKVDKVMLHKEGQVMEFTDYGQFSLN